MNNISLNEGKVELVYDWSTIIPDSDLLLDNLKLYMCRKMMLDKKSVEFMAMIKLGPAHTEVWEAFYHSAEAVLSLLMQGRDAKIQVENYLASVSDDFTQEDFAEVLKPFFDEAMKQIKNKDNVSKVFLHGEVANLKFIEAWMKEYFGEGVSIEKNKPDEDDGFIYAPDVNWD